MSRSVRQLEVESVEVEANAAAGRRDEETRTAMFGVI